MIRLAALVLLLIITAAGGAGAILLLSVPPNSQQQTCPISVTFTPTAANLIDTTVPGTLVANITIATATGAPFNGQTAFVNNPNNNFALSGPTSSPTLVTAGTLIDGVDQVQVSATGGPTPCTPQTIASITPAAASFNGGVGSANEFVASEVATMQPSSPLFAGVWSLSGPDASFFRINSATGVISVGPSDITVIRAYNVTATATPTDTRVAPASQALTLTATTAIITSVSLSNSSFTGNSPSGTVVGNLAVALSGGVTLSGTCASAPNTNGMAISCNIAKTNLGDTVWVASTWCESTGCLTTDTPVATPTASIGSQSVPCVEHPGSRAVVSQSGGDADIWECPNINGATNDSVTIAWPSTVSFLDIYAASLAGVVPSAAAEGGNHFGTTSTGNFQIATSGAASANDIVLALGHRVGDGTTLTPGACTPSPCVALTPQPLAHQLAEYQVLGTSGVVATDVFNTTNSGKTVATIGALKTVGPGQIFSGSLSIVTTGTDHAGTACSSNGSRFQIAGSSLATSGVIPAGNYPGVCVRATQAGLSNSPYTQAFTLIGTGGGAYCSQPAPQEAINAGYTLQLLCLDMSQGNSSWLNFSANPCGGCTFTSPPFIFGRGGMTLAHTTQAAFFTNDPVAGQQVLDVHIDASWLNYTQNPNGNGGSYSPNINYLVTAPDSDTTYLPINGYYEETFRTKASGLSWPVPTGNIDVSFFGLRNCIAVSTCGNFAVPNFEFDTPEMQSSFGPNCDLGYGSWDLPFVLTFGCTNDWANYHTLGTVQTSSVSHNQIFGTEYSDHANPISNNQVSDIASHTTQKSLYIFWFDEKCGQIDGDASCMPGPPWTADLLIKGFRYYTCPNWATTGCAGP